MNLKKYLIGLVILLAFLLRLYRVGQVPVSLYWDEAAIGFNAYTISQTGQDEYGKKLPLFFRSFDDYKLPGYVYSLAPVVKLFGLSEWSVRLPSVIFGTLTVLFTYLLSLQLFKKKRVALLTAFLLAISPWHIQFSRAAFEANGGLFFIVLGAWLFYKYLPLSLISLAVSLYFYRSLHVFVPLLVLVLGISLIKKISKKTVVAAALFLLLSAPILYLSFFSNQNARISQVSIFTQPEKKIVFAQRFLEGYLTQFSPRFLYIAGDPNLRHGLQTFGEQYLWELPFLLIGIGLAVKNFKKYGWLVLAWLILAPIPAALTLPIPHALRGLNIVPVLAIITATALAHFKNKIFVSGITLIATLFLFIYLNQYYFVWSKASASFWADGYKQLVTELSKKDATYDKVIVTGHYWQPYIYFLFYNHQISKKYIFGATGWDKGGIPGELMGVDLKNMAGTGNFLVALSPQEFDGAKTPLLEIGNIYDSSGNLVFIIAKPRP